VPVSLRGSRAVGTGTLDFVAAFGIGVACPYFAVDPGGPESGDVAVRRENTVSARWPGPLVRYSLETSLWVAHHCDGFVVGSGAGRGGPSADIRSESADGLGASFRGDVSGGTRTPGAFWTLDRFVLGVSGSADQSPTYGVEDQFDCAVHVELLHDVSPMGLDGVRAHEQQLGDLLVAPAFRHELKDLALPFGQ
jgi:hypothetical protein